jgi:hypothetical protein
VIEFDTPGGVTNVGEDDMATRLDYAVYKEAAINRVSPKKMEEKGTAKDDKRNI